MPQAAPEQDNIDPITAFWAAPEKNRNAFTQGKHLGRLAATALVIGGMTATGGLLALPAWGLWTLGAVAVSVALSNGLGAGMDQSNGCQPEIGDALVKTPALGNSGRRMFGQGLLNGVRTTFKKLPLAVIGTPFWPVLFVATPFINKGTTGEYFPGRGKRTPPMDITIAAALPPAPEGPSALPKPELLQYSFGAAVKRDTVGAPVSVPAVVPARPSPGTQP